MFVLRHIGIRVHQRVKNVKMEIFVFHMLGFIFFWRIIMLVCIDPHQHLFYSMIIEKMRFYY
jgi:hypothetical protein